MLVLGKKELARTKELGHNLCGPPKCDCILIRLSSPHFLQDDFAELHQCFLPGAREISLFSFFLLPPPPAHIEAKSRHNVSAAKRPIPCKRSKSPDAHAEIASLSHSCSLPFFVLAFKGAEPFVHLYRTSLLHVCMDVWKGGKGSDKSKGRLFFLSRTTREKV